MQAQLKAAMIKSLTMTPLMVTTRMFPTTIRSNMLYHEQEAEAAARFWLFV
jgi:hypothetical protein